MVAAAVVLVSLSLSPALAGESVSSPMEPCRRHECSNDNLVATLPVGPKYGDEELAWTPIPGWGSKACVADPDVPCTTDENRRCYEVALWPEQVAVGRHCEQTRWNDSVRTWTYQPPRTWLNPYDVPFPHMPRFGLRYDYVVRACIGDRCSAWAPKTPEGEQDWVEFRGVFYACLDVQAGQRCEKRCSPAAPKMFPQIPDCSDLVRSDEPDDAASDRPWVAGEEPEPSGDRSADRARQRRATVERRWYRSSGRR